ncbi:MAG: tetratricopeptide repeat protein [Gammaproteobacteria bacterium]|nr:tetratricopeptide repeat protein [Gammaproteobacteria bacterium]
MTLRNDATASLTPRQHEILSLAAKGLTNADIAGVLDISPGTVKVHMAAIYRLLDVSNRTEAALVLRAEQAAANDAPSQGNAIAVLPFDLFSEGDEDAHFADGLVEEIITRLSRWQWFPVIARQSCFAFKRQTNDIRKVGTELGAAYVVEGSVRHSKDTVRVTAQLIDARRNAHLWAETFDGPRSDIFSVQDDIARSVAAAIHPEMWRSEIRQARSQHPLDVDAWQMGMGGLGQIEVRDEAACRKGLALAARALELDPECLAAAYAMAQGNYLQLVFQWTTDPMGCAQAVVQYAALCKRIAPDDPYSFIADGTACMLRGDIDAAIEQLENATKRNPSSARAYSFLGQLLGMRGDPDAGIECLEQAIALSPHDSAKWAMLAAIGICHYGAGRLDQCCHYLHRAADIRDDETLVWSMMASAAATAGWQDEAEAALAELLRVQPGFTIEGFRLVGGAMLPAYLERFEAGLRKAGFTDPG